MATAGKINVEVVPEIKHVRLGNEHNRLEALNQAVRMANMDEPIETTVTRATAFYEFLNAE